MHERIKRFERLLKRAVSRYHLLISESSGDAPILPLKASHLSSVAENDHFCTVIWPESKMLSNRALSKAQKAFFVTNLSKFRIEAESKV